MVNIHGWKEKIKKTKDIIKEAEQKGKISYSYKRMLEKRILRYQYNIRQLKKNEKYIRRRKRRRK